MNKQTLTDLSVFELTGKIRDRLVSSKSLVSECLAQINAFQNDINAFVCWNAEFALQQAQAADIISDQGLSNGPLHGIPIAVKDNYWTSDFSTTGCSKVHQCIPSGIDATAVARLRQAGAIIIGKTNMHEWAYGATNEISAIGPTRNPWNLDHITGGSSGGSGAALATRMVPAALGSDTGGSIRIPSAGCGVCGIKPTYGRVSRYGILPLSWSLDVAGPMARSAKDLSILLSVIAGPDHKDLSSGTIPGKSIMNDAPLDLNELRLAVPNGDLFECSEDVSRVFNIARTCFAVNGADIQEIYLDGMNAGFSAWKVILHSEAAAYHAHFMETAIESYSDGVRIQLEAGKHLRAVDYLKSQQVRSVLNRKLDTLLQQYDALLLPTLPVTAPKIGQNFVSFAGKEVTSQDAMTYIAWLANFSGLPAVSIPCGFGDDGLPVGMMLIGKPDSDYYLLKIADEFQKITDWHLQSPHIINNT
ncbi:MAG: amidase [Spirochaetales bacterium]|jgi:aspartyl-tRNA(Asn)/glutamyl-tRNA(Gln) amidotransferase subunit A|nr:amidase [Spirochaetales bacterium]